jgi:DNA gyrase inhibitor GyrI
MAADEITQRHLQRLRIRGAPSAIPGSAGFVHTYEAEETWRQTCRALVVPLDRGFDAKALAAAYLRLAEAASAQRLARVEEPMFAMKGDPNLDPPHKWEYEAVLPIRGAAKAAPGISIARLDGGMHIASLTRGLADLRNLYVFLFGKFLPSKKQELMRPYILHRVVAGLDEGADDRLDIAVYVPAVLSIKAVPVPGESAEA